MSKTIHLSECLIGETIIMDGPVRGRATIIGIDHNSLNYFVGWNECLSKHEAFCNDQYALNYSIGAASTKFECDLSLVPKYKYGYWFHPTTLVRLPEIKIENPSLVCGKCAKPAPHIKISGDYLCLTCQVSGELC